MRFSSTPMAASKLLLLLSITVLTFTAITAAPAVAETSIDDTSPEPESSTSLRIELDQLYSRLSLLESNLDEKIRELKSKDESIKQMDNIIQEKTTAIASLQSDIQALQQKGSSDAKEQDSKAHARIQELESIWQVENLRQEMEKQNKEKDSLEARANVAEKRVTELNMKLESLQRINDEQKTRIHKIKRPLQVAEEEMMKTKLEATKVSEELNKVREAWIPHWLAVHLLHCQSFVVTHWEEHGKPTLDATVKKALQKKAEVEKWAEPHIETAKTKWIPAVKEQWLKFITQIGPNVKLLTAKTIEFYYTSKNSIEPHVVKVQEMVDPYFQDMKRLTKPYIDQVATMTKPHVEKARVFLRPYTKKVIYNYRKSVKATAVYHRQVQDTIHGKLKNHELTRPLATKELVLFMASALMVLPILSLFKVVSAVFCKKPKKQNHKSHTSHTHRRAKRVHPNK